MEQPRFYPNHLESNGITYNCFNFIVSLLKEIFHNLNKNENSAEK